MSERKQPEKFRVARKPVYKEEKTINMSLRIDKELQGKYDAWAAKTNRSRNELMCMALAYAMDNIEFIEEQEEHK